MPSTRSASPASPRRNDPAWRHCPMPSPKSCASWCGCGNACCRTSVIACGNCTAWSTSGSLNSLATCALWTANSPAPSCAPTRPRPRSAASRSSGWLRYDERHPVGLELARTLIDAARRSVGQHHSPAYRLQIRYACDDLDVLRRRLRELDRDLDDTLRQHEIARLLLTIDGIGPHTAAYVIAEVG